MNLLATTPQVRPTLHDLEILTGLDSRPTTHRATTLITYSILFDFSPCTNSFQKANHHLS